MTKNRRPNLVDLRVAVQSEFVKRCRKNSSYSLRAYAQFLEMDQSLLSKIMRDERRISKKAAEKIGAKLGLKPSEFAVPVKQDTFLPLADDEFEVISEWYHFAILELFKTKGFDPAPEKIAKRFGLHVAEVRGALERLHRLGLIKIEAKRATLVSRNNTWSSNARATAARNLLQKRFLEKSLDALETIPFELRDHSSRTVAVSKKRLPEFREKIRQVRMELGEFFQDGGPTDEVYQLQISFFPLTKIDRNQS